MKQNKNVLILVAMYLAYTAIYVARMNLSMASPGLRDINVLSTTKIGTLGSIFTIIYAFGRFFNGGLSDKISPYKMIGTGLLLCGKSNIIIGFFPPYIAIIACWGVNGFAQSMLWSSILCVVSVLYEKEKAKKITSYMVSTVAVGNILGIILNTIFINTLGIEFAFIVPGGITLVLSFACIILLKGVKINEKTEEKHISVFGLFKEKDVRTISVPAFLHGMIKDNITIWMTVYFATKYSLNLQESTYFILFIPVLGFIGRLIYPFVYRICKNNEHSVSKIGFIVCGISSTIICFLAFSPVIDMICLSLTYMAISLINTSILSIFPIQYQKTGNVASVSGIMDLVTYGGAGISSFIYGFIIDKFGYSPMYFTWIICSVISIFVTQILIKSRKNCNLSL